MFKICMENRIVRREKDYKCFLCHCEEIDNNFNAILEHLKYWRHKKVCQSFSKTEKNKELDAIHSISETQRKTLVENHIAIANRQDQNYRCYLCLCYLPSLISVFEHMQTFTHKTNFKKKFKNTLTLKKDQEEESNIVARIGKVEMNKKIFFENEYWCSVCQICLTSNALVKCHCLLHLFQKHNVEQNDVIFFDLKENDSVNITCLLCQVTLDSHQSLVDHANTSSHLSAIKFSYNKTENKEIFSKQDFEVFDDYVKVINIICKVCSASIPESENDKHIHSEEHCENVWIFNLRKNVQLKNKKTYSKLDNSNKYMCFICDKTYINVHALLKHYNGSEHQSKISSLHVILNKGSSNKHNERDDSKNKSKKMAVNDVEQDLVCESKHNEKLVLITSRASAPITINKIHKLGQLDLKADKKELLIPRTRKPRRPNKHKNIQSQFDKNLAIHANTYIQMCIESGDESVYNVSEETIRLLRLSTKLIFPCHSTWICIPCISQIEDDEFLVYQHLHDKKHTDYVYKLEANHEDFKNYPDQFSDLELAKAYMQEESDEYVQCHACNIKVSNFDDTIRQHLQSDQHILRSESIKTESEELFKTSLTILKNSWYYAHMFVCEICKSRFNSEFEFIMHLQSEEHVQETNKVTLKGTRMKFDVCPICVTCWYGEFDAYSEHIENSSHKHFLTTSEFMIPKLSSLTGALLNEPETNVNYLIDECNKTINQEQDQVFELLKAIEKTVQSSYPNAKAYTSGSWLSQLGFLDDDLDVFLDCENMYNTNVSKEQNDKYLNSVKSLFENQQHRWIIEDSLSLRAPLIKLEYLPTYLKCNLRFTSGLNVEESKLVKYFNVAFPICRQLILYLKEWLDLCQLMGSDGISTSAISWLVIFYLQIKEIFPSVHQLMKLKNKSTIVNGWECGFVEEIPVTLTNLSFRDLLKGFFLYYADFDYRSDVICPFLGKIIKKSCFANNKQLPQELYIYEYRISKGEVELFRFDSPMCVQDPVDHSHNATKTVTKLKLQCFMQYCAESLEHKCPRDDENVFHMY